MMLTFSDLRKRINTIFWQYGGETKTPSPRLSLPVYVQVRREGRKLPYFVPVVHVEATDTWFTDPSTGEKTQCLTILVDEADLVKLAQRPMSRY